MAPMETEARADIQGMASAETEGNVRAGRKSYSDKAVNYSDQKRNINMQLLRLDLEWLAQAARENIGIISSALLLGGAAAFLVKRKYAIGGGLVAALLAEQFLLRQRPEEPRALPAGRSRREEIELERIALKTERGDYGKIDVIAFK